MAVVEQRLKAFLSNEDSPDIGNPIHSTVVAKQFGFRGALVGGVTVWGWATPAILEALGEGWLDRGWAEFAFRQPTYPGDDLALRIEPAEGDPRTHSVTMTNQEGVVCVVGTVGLGDAAWLGEFVTPGDMTAKPSPAPIPPIVMGETPTGVDWLPVAIQADSDEIAEFAGRALAGFDARFIGEGTRLHPGWIAGRAERVMRHNVTMPQSIHTRSRIQHLAPAYAGQTIVTGAHLREIVERRGHHIATFDCLVAGEDGTHLARLRHSTIVRVAKPEERV